MTDFANEQWRDIPGYPGYSISNYGRTKSNTRIIQRKNQPSYQLKEKILKNESKNRRGGYPVFQGSINGKFFSMDLHRAMAITFLGPREEGYEVRHIDGNPKNNRLENLCYGTRSENIADAKRHGTFPVLEKRPGAKLTRSKAIEIAGSSESTKILSEKYGVCAAVIYQIKKGQTWESVTREARKINPWKKKKLEFTPDQIKIICDTSKSLRSINRELGINRTVIKRVRRDSIKDI